MKKLELSTTVSLEPKIVSENSDYMVVDKPAGLIVHGGPGITEATLVDWLIKKNKKLKDVGEDPLRPGIVHRLDKEASGLMVIAKNNQFFKHLKKQFQDREVVKTYIALAYGKIDKDEGEINFPLRRAASGHKVAALPMMAGGMIVKKRLSGRDLGMNEALLSAREAITIFKVAKKLINYTLLSVNIKTGRTHQIRAHFAAYGHPLVGDDLYGTKKTRIKNKKLGLGRIFLLAEELSFKDLDDQKQTFKVELPAKLADFLKTAK